LGDERRDGLEGSEGFIGVFLMESFRSIWYFPFDLGTIEYEGLEVQDIVGGVVGVRFLFFLDNSFSRLAAGVVFLRSRWVLVFFPSDARIENAELLGQQFIPSYLLVHQQWVDFIVIFTTEKIDFFNLVPDNSAKIMF
jgi:hypothetical protein